MAVSLLFLLDDVILTGSDKLKMEEGLLNITIFDNSFVIMTAHSFMWNVYMI